MPFRFSDFCVCISCVTFCSSGVPGTVTVGKFYFLLFGFWTATLILSFKPFSFFGLGG
jgi:hypothetical protein